MMSQAIEFDDAEIAAEAYRLWEESGSSLWGNPHDHWFRAIERLRERADAAAAGGESQPLPSGPIGKIGKDVAIESGESISPVRLTG